MRVSLVTSSRRGGGCDVAGAGGIGLGMDSGSSRVEVRFALYGRMLTRKVQDRETFTQWQTKVAEGGDRGVGGSRGVLR